MRRNSIMRGQQISRMAGVKLTHSDLKKVSLFYWVQWLKPVNPTPTKLR